MEMLTENARMDENTVQNISKLMSPGQRKQKIYTRSPSDFRVRVLPVFTDLDSEFLKDDFQCLWYDVTTHVFSTSHMGTATCLPYTLLQHLLPNLLNNKKYPVDYRSSFEDGI